MANIYSTSEDGSSARKISADWDTSSTSSSSSSSKSEEHEPNCIRYNEKKKQPEFFYEPVDGITECTSDMCVVETYAVAMSSKDEVDSKYGYRRICENPIDSGEFVGRLVSTPRQGDSLGPGDWVYGFSPSDQPNIATICVGRSQLCAVPPGVGVECAAYPMNFLTAYQGLTRTGILYFKMPMKEFYYKMNSKKKILITHAHNSVGIFAVQIARAAGVGHITATCEKSKMDFVRSLGAHDVYDCDTPPGDLTDWPQEDFEPPFNGVLDTAGGQTPVLAAPLLRSNVKVATTRYSHMTGIGDREPTPSGFRSVNPIMDGEDLEHLSILLQPTEGRPLILPPNPWQYQVLLGAPTHRNNRRLRKGWKKAKKNPLYDKVVFVVKDPLALARGVESPENAKKQILEQQMEDCWR